MGHADPGLDPDRGPDPDPTPIIPSGGMIWDPSSHLGGNIIHHPTLWGSLLQSGRGHKIPVQDPKALFSQILKKLLRSKGPLFCKRSYSLMPISIQIPFCIPISNYISIQISIPIPIPIPIPIIRSLGYPFSQKKAL